MASADRLRKNNKSSTRKAKRAPLRRAPSKNSRKEGIVVGASDLKWKAVQVPDTLGDFGGFYGLEEIDGVDVKVVDGKVQFIARDESKVRQSNGGNSSDQESSEEKQSDELIEFKNLDDVDEGELEASSFSETSDISADETNENEEQEADDNASAHDDNDELQPNVFQTDIDLDDIEVSELPEWGKLGPLSLTTLQGLAKLGFSKPTEIQSRAIPVAMQGKDVMGKAATGSGKTLAYGIPVLERLVKSKNNTSPVALIFTPTRELAQQVNKHLQALGKAVLKNSPYAIIPLTGGLSIHKQERLLDYQGSGRIVVATPGRFLELIERNTKLLDRFARIETLILDEADRLLQDGHFEEFEKILKHLGNSRRKNVRDQGWQTMVYSATFAMDLFSKLSSTSWSKMKRDKHSDEMEAVLQQLMKKIHFKSKPIIIDTNSEQRISSQIKESLIECGPLERDLYCYYFVTMYPGTTLVFCNSIDSVKKLNAYLNHLKVPTFQIHSSMTQKNRLRNLERYQQQSEKNRTLNKSTVLIASDVAARGLDIPNIEHVIHYHLPRSADVYIHRSGRTARAEKEGVSVMLCSPEEAQGPLRKLRKLLALKSGSDETANKKKKWQKTVPLLPIETDIVTQLRERSKIASKLADNEIASTSLKKDDNWLKKAAEDLEINISSDEEDKDVILAKNKTKKINKTISKDRVRGLKAELDELLGRPLRKDLRKKYLTGGLVNLADNLVKKRGHDFIIGHEKVDALEQLKKKRSKH
ncbi:hypothetical protein HG536_0G02240 [Torulaspora globosa]|uniref:RNA helicase n=1 Tax=Torulaspora globosa TaxID=48254 RepID=A0A7G3ZLH9_9SACH|nr:uncharacterized protein HG536_0G02240 [Torulaspora globosa]QLL34365.1 hypothetical protein HG536_0G02240 [Torulaspora globosa]